MKLGTFTTVVVAATAVPALGLGLGLGTAALIPAALASARTPSSDVTIANEFSEQAVVIDCQGQPQVRPENVTLACADGNDYLEINDCNPYCAAGHFHGYPVDVTFRGSASVHGHPGRQRYTKVTLIYRGARPDFYRHQAPEISTLPLPAPSS
jgi:hypothetical protein